MLSAFRVYSQSYVGLSLHCEELRLIKVSKMGVKSCVEDFAVIKLPRGFELNRMEELKPLIQESVQAMGLKNCFCAMALSFSEVINKKIKLPNYLNDAEQRLEIQENIQNYFPGISGGVSFDCVRTNDNAKDASNLILVAAREERIKQLKILFDGTGLKLRVIDVDSYALARVATILKFTDLTWLIEIDMEQTKMLAVLNGEILFCHHVTLDSRNSQFITMLVNNIRNSIKQWQKNTKYEGITKISLAGKYESLVEIRDALNIQDDSVEIHNPFAELILTEKIRENLALISSAFWIPLGLVLRSFPKW